VGSARLAPLHGAWPLGQKQSVVGYRRDGLEKPLYGLAWASARLQLGAHRPVVGQRGWLRAKLSRNAGMATPEELSKSIEQRLRQRLDEARQAAARPRRPRPGHARSIANCSRSPASRCSDPPRACSNSSTSLGTDWTLTAVNPAFRRRCPCALLGWRARSCSVGPAVRRATRPTRSPRSGSHPARDRWLGRL
jgi:hypothetical protein